MLFSDKTPTEIMYTNFQASLFCLVHLLCNQPERRVGVVKEGKGGQVHTVPTGKRLDFGW